MMDYLLELRRRWWRRVTENGLKSREITVKARTLEPEEAIGRPLRRDYPLLRGKEVMVQAEIGEAVGQAFTDEPTSFQGTLKDLYDLDITRNSGRALLIAGINATYRLLRLIEGTRHCRDDGPELCAAKISETLFNLYGDVKISLIGFQPAILSHLLRRFSNIRVTDMDEENIGRSYYGIMIEPYQKNQEVISWSELILATGSTIVNNTIQDILRWSNGKPTYFYGVTIAALACEFNLNRLCFNSL
ncbi:MAG: DUF364 domain-containing protein [Nitrososphaerota archaeon]